MNRRWQLAVVLAPVLAALEPAHAISSVYLDIRAGASSYDVPTQTPTVDASPNNNVFGQTDPVFGVNASHIESRSTGSATAFASGSAIANPAGVHVATNIAGSGNGSDTTQASGSANTDVQAATGDSFTLLVPSLPSGAPLTLTASWYTSGSLFASYSHSGSGEETANAYAVWSADFALIPSSGGEGLYQNRSGGCQHDQVAQACWGPEFGTEPAVVTVANGALVGVSISARVRAWGSSPQSGPGTSTMNAFADLGDTVAWGGITSVKDAGGNDLPDYTALSPETGYDYRFAYVPEPSAAFTAAAALLSLALRRRAAASA